MDPTFQFLKFITEFNTSLLFIQNPKPSKLMWGDRLWQQESEVAVIQTDPIVKCW